MKIDYSTRPDDLFGIIKWQEEQVGKLLTDDIRSRMRTGGLDDEIYEDLRTLPELGAGLTAYLVYAIELGDNKFQSTLMHDMHERGKSVCIESAPLAKEHYQRITEAGFSRYRDYLESGRW